MSHTRHHKFDHRSVGASLIKLGLVLGVHAVKRVLAKRDAARRTAYRKARAGVDAEPTPESTSGHHADGRPP